MGASGSPHLRDERDDADPHVIDALVECLSIFSRCLQDWREGPNGMDCAHGRDGRFLAFTALLHGASNFAHKCGATSELAAYLTYRQAMTEQTVGEQVLLLHNKSGLRLGVPPHCGSFFLAALPFLVVSARSDAHLRQRRSRTSMTRCIGLAGRSSRCLLLKKR